MYRRCYSVNDMPQIITDCKENKQECSAPAKKPNKNIEEELGIIKEGKFLGKFEIDDIILIAILVILLVDDCDDKLLFFAIAFIFVSGVL